MHNPSEQRARAIVYPHPTINGASLPPMGIFADKSIAKLSFQVGLSVSRMVFVAAHRIEAPTRPVKRTNGSDTPKKLDKQKERGGRGG